MTETGRPIPTPSLLAGRRRLTEQQEEAPRSPTSAYLSFLHSAPGEETVVTVGHHVEDWLEEKWLGSRDRITVNTEPVLVDPPTSTTVQLLRSEVDSGDALCLNIRESGNEPGPTFFTEITAFQPHDESGQGWVGVAVHNDRDEYCGTPRVARRLVDALDLFDGEAQVLSRPAVVSVKSDLDALVDTLVDPNRRYPVIVGATDTQDTMPIDVFVERVTSWTRDTAGQGQVLIVKPEMSRLLTSQLPKWLLPQPFSLRTYLPGIDIEDPRGGVRHRILTARTLARRPEKSIRAILTGSVRAAATSVTFPADQVDSVKSQMARRLRDDRLRTLARARPRPQRTSRTTVPPPMPRDPLVESLVTAVLEALGAGELSTSVIDQTVDLLTAPTSNVDELLAEVAKQDRRVDEALAQIASMKQRLDDKDETILLLEAELSSAEGKQLELVARDRHFQRKLAAFDAPAAYAPPPPFEEATDFFDVLDRVEGLRHVIFTGKEDVTLELAKGDKLGTEARTAWRAFVTLEAFAEHYLAGGDVRTLKQFLETNPEGTTQIGVGKWAPTESEQTLNRYGDSRTFPVPMEVSPQGRVLMKAHFRLGQQDSRAPRMHYFDDLDGTRKFYVGYVGVHLPNTKTASI